MGKPKFKMKKRELLEFNDAAGEIYLLCPQVRPQDLPFEDRQILLGEISVKEVVECWLDKHSSVTSEVMFELGYVTAAKKDCWEHYDTFKEVSKLYKAHKVAKKYYKLMRKEKANG